MFKDVKKIEFTYSKQIEVSQHLLSAQRKYRIEGLRDILSEEIVDVFYVDRNHKNGPEIHIVTCKATILILNFQTKKLCTILFARPGQVRRYYQACQMVAPEKVIEAAHYNLSKHRNNL